METMNEEENWRREYPEGSLGWKTNNKIDAVVEHAVKSGRILMFLFVVLFTPAVIEIAAYPHGPFFAWRLAFDGVNSAQWNMVIYVVVLLMLAGAFFYCAVWLELENRKTDSEN
jgi:hypothetical protein